MCIRDSHRAAGAHLLAATICRMVSHNAAGYAESVRKVLVVEDDEDVREVLRETLEDAGYPVICAKDGREGLELLRAEPRPCLVLLDLMMPVLSGWQFRAQQQQDPRLARSP